MADDPRFIGDDPDPDPPPADPKAARAAAGPRFKRDEAAAAGRRTTAAVVALFLLAVLAALLVAWAVQPRAPDRPRLETVHIERYDRPGWPTAAWARADAARLAEAFADPGGRRTADEDRTFHQADKLRERLGAVKAGLAAPANANRPLVLSVSALAGVTPDGAPCLLPTDADPFDPARWVPLADVLDALAGSTSAPPRLLLLDLARPTADPHLGRPEERAADAVHKLLKDRQAAGTLPCPVLAATGPGEVSLPAPRAGQSAFGLYLADGLLGAAADDAGDVTAGRLARFVAARVRRYARDVHGRPQHPQLYAPAGGWDFVLARTSAPPPVPSAEPPKPEEVAYPAGLTAQWKRWDGLAAGGAGRDHPEAFARLTAALLRADRLWLGTDDAGAAGQECERAFNSWAQEAGGSRPGGRAADDGPDPRAKAGRHRLAARDEPPPAPELARLVDRYLTALAADPPRPDGGRAERQELAEKAAGNPAAARLVWGRLCDAREPTRASVRGLTDLLAELTPADQPMSAEVALARYLRARDYEGEQRGLGFPAGPITLWLRAEDRLGRALAAGPAGFVRVRAALEVGERLRKDAAGRLFRATSRAEAEEAGRQFARAIERFTEAAAEARAVARPAAAVPPLLAAVLAFEPMAAAAGGDELARWTEAVRACDALLAGRTDPATSGRLADEAAAAEKRLRDTATPARVEELERRRPSWNQPAEVQTAAALVAGPVLPADGRAKVWGLVRRELALLHAGVRRQDAADDENRADPPPVAAPQAADPDPADRRRAETAAALVRLAGGSGGDPAGWWRAEVPQRAGRAAADGDAAALDRLLRVVPPAAAAARTLPAGLGADALAGPARAARTEYRRWVTDQLLRGYDTPLAGKLTLWDKMDPDSAVRRAVAALD